MTIQDKTRRTELGKVLLDVAKYVLTIVVIGGLVSERVNFGNILFGLAIALGFMIAGFHVIPREEAHAT